MRKLFSALSSASAHGASGETEVRFTRFETAGVPNSSALISDKKFTRFAAQHKTRTPAVTHRQPQTEPVSPTTSRHGMMSPALQQSANAMDHLTSEADIPLSIFRKALPQRFAKIHENKHDAEIAAFFS